MEKLLKETSYKKQKKNKNLARSCITDYFLCPYHYKIFAAQFLKNETTQRKKIRTDAISWGGCFFTVPASAEAFAYFNFFSKDYVGLMNRYSRVWFILNIFLSLSLSLF